MANDNPFANSVEQQYSRYVQGGDTDKYNNRTGWWERRELPRRDDDVTLKILPGEGGRPDLISYRAYGHAKYAWLVLQYNSIVDINTELTVGTEVILPSESRLMLDILNQNTGGNLIT